MTLTNMHSDLRSNACILDLVCMHYLHEQFISTRN